MKNLAFVECSINALLYANAAAVGFAVTLEINRVSLMLL